MRKAVITICALSLALLKLSAQENQVGIPPLTGWRYYGGDEFNGTSINRKLWGIYGDKTKQYSFDTYGNNKDQGMAQTYRDQMVTVRNGLASIRATREAIRTGLRKEDGDPSNTDYSVKMRDPIPPKHGYTKQGWWSGALSGRDADGGGNYYPLYSRIEIKAKIPFCIGTWMSLWLRHSNGSSLFEIDLEEFFVNDDARAFAGKHGYNSGNANRYVHQSIHGLDYNLGMVYDKKKQQYVFVNGYNHNAYTDRIKPISFNPSDDFHVYGAQIDPEPDDSARHLAVTFLLDGRVRSVFRTIEHKTADNVIDPRDKKPMKDKYPYRYNALLKKENMKFGIDRVWDVAITGQIGGKHDDSEKNKGGGVLYPEEDPQYNNDINKVPKNYVMDIDWLRVYKRANRLIWIGSQPAADDQRQTKGMFQIPTGRLGKLKVGDKLILDIDTLSANEHRGVGPSSIDICSKQGASIVALKPHVARNDAQVTFYVTDNHMLEALKKDGCYVKGDNIRIFSLVHEVKESSLWSGFKHIDEAEVIIPKLMFDQVREGRQLEFVVRDVSAKGKIFLPQFNNSIDLSASREEMPYRIELKAEHVKMLRENGLQIAGSGYYLRNVRLIDRNTTTGINTIAAPQQEAGAVYSINGVKVRDAHEAGELPPGIYIIDGKKVIVK